MARRAGTIRVKRKEVVTVAEYDVPDPAFIDSEGRQFVLESNLDDDYLESDLHMDGRVPVSLVPIGPGNRKDFDVRVPNERVLGLEDLLADKKGVVVRSADGLVPYAESGIRAVRFTGFPKHAGLQHFVDPTGTYLGTRSFGPENQAACSVSEIASGRLISSGTFHVDSGLWAVSDMLFGDGYACLVHAHKTDVDPHWDPDEVRDYIHVMNLESGEYACHQVCGEGWMHFDGVATAFGKFAAIPLLEASSRWEEGLAPTKGMAVVDMETGTVTTDPTVRKQIGGIYTPLFGIPGEGKAYFLLSNATNYAMISVDEEANIAVEAKFKGASFKRYTYLGQACRLETITNIDIEDGVISALIRPEDHMIIRPDNVRKLYAVAFGYDIATGESSFFPLPAPGVDIPLREEESVMEFFLGKMGQNIPVLEQPQLPE